jgi:Zn-dependent peptidase ImmA (M78 family)
MTAFLDDLVRRHGVPYRFSKIPEGRRSYLLAGVVILDESLTEERAHWAYCHELAHLLLDHPETPPADYAEELQREGEANQLASQLILPDETFKPHAHRRLTELKSFFPHASYEVIARRRLQFRFGLLTIVDNQRVTTRIAPESWNRPMRLLPLEMKALERCSTSKSESILEEEGMRVEATYVDEGWGVIRVILFTEEK